ncbi:hypothetical protein JCM17823_22170 [Halorubrum gandharaense]
MTGDSSRLRLRRFLADNFAVVVAALVVVALVGGFIAVSAHTGDETRTEVRTTAAATTDASFTHGATVERDTAVFDAGERLENRSRYFTSVAPELDGEYALAYAGDGAAVADAELSLVVRSVEEVDGETVVHWRDAETLATREAEDVAADDPLVVPFSVDVPAQEERVAAIEEDLDASPGSTEILVEPTVTLDGEVGEESTAETRTERLEIDPQDGTYHVSAEMDGPTEHEATETVTVPVEPGPLRAYGAPLVALLAAVAAGTLIRDGRRGRLDVTAAERDRLAHERDREAFDEWISAGSLPRTDAETVEMETLEGLVDVAIDSDRRVIESDGRYYVLLDDVRYVYEPPRPARGEFDWGT